MTSAECDKSDIIHLCRLKDFIYLHPSGAKSLLADDHLAQQDVALLAVLDFLCECGTVQPLHGLFKPQHVQQRLMLLLKQIDFSKALHVRMVGRS